MKMFSTLLISVLLSLAARAGSSSIEGRWELQESENNVSFDVTFFIEAHSVTMTNICTVNGSSVTAQVVVASSYDGSGLTLLESRQDQKSIHGVNCHVNAEAGIFNYVMKANSVIFTEQGYNQSFTLIRKN